MEKILFLLFAVVFVVYLWYTFITVYHLVRFGIGVQPKKIAFIFLAGSLILLAIVVYAYGQVDWRTDFNFNI